MVRRRVAGLLSILYWVDAAPWLGADMSQLGTEDSDGASPPFRVTAGGKPIDALHLLKERGATTFRMRLWNDPCADGRCDSVKYAYGGLDGALLMAKRCQDAGLQFVLDFHYSDWWADPGQQFKPTAWRDLSFDALTEAIASYTRKTLTAFAAQGTPPVAIQVGNEITHGMLWHNESLGQPCTDGGKLWNCEADKDQMWMRFAKLVDAGIQGAREALPSCEIAIHTDLGNHIQDDGGIGWVITWYQSLNEQLQVLASARGGNLSHPTFDRIGLSMYPDWDEGHTFQNIAKLPELAAAFPMSRIYIAETSYPAAGDKQPESKYAATPAGQLKFLQDVVASMAAVLPAAQNGGVLWWEGSESGWKSLFDSDYVARPALLHGFAASPTRGMTV